MFVLEAHELTAKNTYLALFSIHLYKQQACQTPTPDFLENKWKQ